MFFEVGKMMGIEVADLAQQYSFAVIVPFRNSLPYVVADSVR